MEQSQITAEFQKKQYIDIDQAKVFYNKAGEGSALVLLHGFPLSGMTWRKVVAELSKYFTCYAFDLVGFGGSTSPNTSDFSSQGQAKVIQQAISKIGISKYALVGNNSGGWIARELALLDVERITHLALINTEIPGHRPPWIGLYQLLAELELPGTNFLLRFILALRIARRSGMAFGGCFENLDLIDGEFAELFISPLLASKERLSSTIKFLAEMNFKRLDQFRELHGKLSMPVAFLWGDADPTFPEQIARSMIKQFPNVTYFKAIPKGKLFVHEEQPSTVAKMLIDFVKVS